MTKYAIHGSHPELRAASFKVKALMKAKVIGKASMGVSDHKFFDGLMLLDSWNTYQAQKLYELVRKYTPELKTQGVYFENVPRPIVKSQAASMDTSKSVDYHKGWFILRQPRNELILKKFKSTGTSGIDYQYIQDHKAWKIAEKHGQLVKDIVERYHYQISDIAKSVLYECQRYYDLSIAHEPIHEIDAKIKRLPMKHPQYTLDSYQRIGIYYTACNPGSILGDVPGLGKTAQGIGTTIAWNMFPCLIIAPKSLMNNWKQEVEAWSKKKAMIVTEKNCNRLHLYHEIGQADYFIINYDSVEKYFTQSVQRVRRGKKMVFDVEINDRAKIMKSFIIEEIHELCNMESRRYKVIEAVMHGRKHRLGVSGTLLRNKMADIAAVVNLVGRISVFQGMGNFLKSYTEDQGPDKANWMLRSRGIMVRRHDKEKILGLLPKKRTQARALLTNQPQYHKAENAFKAWLQQNGRSDNIYAEALARMNTLRQLSAQGKMQTAKKIVDAWIAQGEQVVVFAWHRQTIRDYLKLYPHAVTIYGDDRIDEIEESKVKFNQGKANPMLCSYLKAGVGQNLQAACKLLIHELPWTPDRYEQAEERIWRRGQTREVDVVQLLGGSIDDHMFDIVLGKWELLNRSLGSSDQGQVEKKAVGAVLAAYMGNK